MPVWKVFRFCGLALALMVLEVSWRFVSMSVRQTSVGAFMLHRKALDGMRGFHSELF